MGSLVVGHSLPYRDKPVAYPHFEQRKWFSYRPVQLFTAGPESDQEGECTNKLASRRSS